MNVRTFAAALGTAAMLLGLLWALPAAAQSPSPSTAPSASATATTTAASGTPVANPTASPSPTPAASPTVVVNGRPCEVGTLINGFLLYQDPSAPPERLPVPIPSCVQPVSATASPRLYGLALPGDQYVLDRNESAGHHTTLVYRTVATNEVVAQIIARRDFRDPEPIAARDPADFHAADFLPAPGVYYDFANAHSAMWIEPSGLYYLIADNSPLDLKYLAGLLRPLDTLPMQTATSTPVAPVSGSGVAPHSSNAPSAIVLLSTFGGDLRRWVRRNRPKRLKSGPKLN